MLLSKKSVDKCVKDSSFVGYAVFVVGTCKSDFEFYLSGWGNTKRVPSLNTKTVECCYKL